MGADGGSMCTEFGGNWYCDHYFKSRKSAKVHKLKLVLILMKKGLWFFNTVLTIFLLVMFIYPDLDANFLAFFLSSHVIYF